MSSDKLTSSEKIDFIIKIISSIKPNEMSVPVFVRTSNSVVIVTGEYIISMKDVMEMSGLNKPDNDTYFGEWIARINQMLKERDYPRAKNEIEAYIKQSSEYTPMVDKADRTPRPPKK